MVRVGVWFGVFVMIITQGRLSDGSVSMFRVFGGGFVMICTANRGKLLDGFVICSKGVCLSQPMRVISAALYSALLCCSVHTKVQTQFQ